MQTLLTIAGFDPSSGAGVTADLMVFRAHGFFGTSCITALTVQSTLGVRTTHPVKGAIVSQTLECLEADLAPAGVKIGMTASVENILEISNHLARYLAKIRTTPSETMLREARQVPVVLDPVLRSSSGRELADAGALLAIKHSLLPLIDWVTPNTEELAAFTGERIESRRDVERACRLLQAESDKRRGGRKLGVLATGGHMEPPDDFLLAPEGNERWLAGQRVETRSTHGTGCALSSALLCRLVLGDTATEAATAAKAYVAEALRRAPGLGSGHGPMNHLWPLCRAED